MAQTGIRLRIHGALNAQGQVIKFRDTTKQRIVAILDSATPDAVERMRDDLYARYTEGSGQTAGSLAGEVDETSEGAGVRIKIRAGRQVRYMTTLLPESDYRGTPYPIRAKKQFLQFYWKRIGRKVSIRQVQHPGFGPTDVLRQAAERELSVLGYLVEYEVRSAVAEVQSGGRILRPSGRR